MKPEVLTEVRRVARDWDWTSSDVALLLAAIEATGELPRSA